MQIQDKSTCLINWRNDDYMKYSSNHMEQYIPAKEFVDTIIIPLIPFHFSADAEMKKLAFQAEVATIFAGEIEKELSGRVMLIPPYYYVKPLEQEVEVKRLNTWVQNMETQPFTNFFFLTFDPAWKKCEKDLTGNLLWFPSIQSGDVHASETHHLITDQVAQVSELIRSFW